MDYYAQTSCKLSREYNENMHKDMQFANNFFALITRGNTILTLNINAHKMCLQLCSYPFVLNIRQRIVNTQYERIVSIKELRMLFALRNAGTH